MELSEIHNLCIQPLTSDAVDQKPTIRGTVNSLFRHGRSVAAPHKRATSSRSIGNPITSTGSFAFSLNTLPSTG